MGIRRARKSAPSAFPTDRGRHVNHVGQRREKLADGAVKSILPLLDQRNARRSSVLSAKNRAHAIAHAQAVASAADRPCHQCKAELVEPALRRDGRFVDRRASGTCGAGLNEVGGSGTRSARKPRGVEGNDLLYRQGYPLRLQQFNILSGMGDTIIVYSSAGSSLSRSFVHSNDHSVYLVGVGGVAGCVSFNLRRRRWSSGRAGLLPCR